MSDEPEEPAPSPVSYNIAFLLRNYPPEMHIQGPTFFMGRIDEAFMKPLPHRTDHANESMVGCVRRKFLCSVVSRVFFASLPSVELLNDVDETDGCARPPG